MSRRGSFRWRGLFEGGQRGLRKTQAGALTSVMKDMGGYRKAKIVCGKLRKFAGVNKVVEWTDC